MAALLGVSPRTVEFHRASIRKQLGITTEWGLMRFAIMLRVNESEDDGVADADVDPDSNDVERKTPPSSPSEATAP